MKPVIVVETFSAPVSKVWKAITDQDEMKHWYFENIDHFEPRVGSRSKFEVQSGNNTFTHLWKVTDVIPQKKISYSWKYEEYQGDSNVSFELVDKGEKTMLTLTAVFTANFPDDVPEFKRESCLGGWQYFIQERLKSYLETKL